MTQSEPQRVQPVGAARFGGRNIAIALLIVALMLLLAVGQWLQIQSGQDVARALSGTTRVGPVDMKYTGMRFSRDHMLVARYEISGIQDVTTARWHAKPWGYVVLQP
jgi:hypothetical protein